MRNFIVDDLTESDIDHAVGIWIDQNRRYCSNDDAFPAFWRNNSDEIARFLQARIQRKAARALRLPGDGTNLCGYLVYDKFPFNGEMSTFCPALAHAVVEEHKEAGYLALYRGVSQEWVNQNILNHMWTINFNDLKLRNVLYDLGFGSYVIDAFACSDAKIDCAFAGSSSFMINKASESEAEALYDLVEESRLHYSAAPIFLKREPFQMDDLRKLIKESNVFIAWDNKKAIGFINVSISEENNSIEMSMRNDGLIDEIGVYIQPGYRGGKGLGKQLLTAAFDYCRNNGIPRIHVDFETANSYANRFWRKDFSPMLLSVRRTINKNINTNDTNDTND